MATPINSKANQVQTASPAASELLARLQASAQADSASGGAFNAWMARHAMTAEQLGAPPQSKPAAAHPEAPQRDPNSTAAKLLDQALQRSRQQAMGAVRQTEQTVVQAQSNQAAQKQAAAKSKSEGPSKAERRDVAGRGEAPAPDATKAGDADGDSAIVKELTPPPDVRTDDAQAMMAWLASLTQGEPTHARKPLATGGAQGSGQDTDLAAGAPDARGKFEQDAATAAAAAKPGPGTLDMAGWQATHAGQQVVATEAATTFREALNERTTAAPVEGLTATMGMRAPTEMRNLESARVEMATLQAPVGSDGFAQALGDQLTMWVQKMPDDGAMQAELHLNPAEMGPIHVKISLDGQDAHVDFAAAAVETRQAIEASLTALSTAFSDVGLNLAGGGVSAQTTQQNAQQSGQPGGSPAGGGGQSGGERDAREAAGPGRAAPLPRSSGLGGLDLYA